LGVDPHTLTVAGLAAGLKARQYSSLDLTLHFLGRIERHAPALNAFVTITADRALEDARRAGRAIVTLAVTNFDVGVGEARDIIEGLGTYSRVSSDYFEAVRDYDVALAALSRIVGEEVTDLDVATGREARPAVAAGAAGTGLATGPGAIPAPAPGEGGRGEEGRP